jgi:membrane protein YqaA with SNARE-associated domain
MLAFAESSFFPVPPDVLLIALAISVPERAFFFALICAVGSVLGGVGGYIIGYGFMEAVGDRIIHFYGFAEQWARVGDMYNRYAGWAVGIAGFTPIPYKVFTIAAGAFKINFPIFLVASAISRSARFFLLALLIYHFGPPIRLFIDKYFNLLVIAFTVLLLGGFLLIKYVF